MTAALLQNRRARLGLALLALFAIVALVGPLVAGDPDEPVGVPLAPPSTAHWLGTTGQGQDVLAQTVVGARHSLALGLVVAVLVVGLGALVGTTAATLGGTADELLSLLINLFLVLPGLPLMVVLAAYLPPGPAPTAVALVVTGWAWSARVFRAQARSLRATDFVAAAIVAGEPPLRVMAFEILPHMTALLVSSFIGAAVYAIGAEAGLEFLGLGDLGRVSWGTSLYWARSEAALITGSWWTFVPAGGCLGLVGFALAAVNRGVDEVADPRLRETRPPLASPPALAEVVLPPTPDSLPAPAAGSVRPPAAGSGAAVPCDPLLVVEELRVAYGASTVLDGLSLSIARGEAVGLLGPSGSGKSTLALALLRLLPPGAAVTAGRARYRGVDLAAMDEQSLCAYRGQRLALVPQQAQSALSPFLTVRSQLADARDGDLSDRRATDLLSLVGLPSRLLGRYPHQLSAGMRQRVVLAIALAGSPELLILDEPTSALDAVAQREILALVAGLKSTLGLSLLLIGHDPHVVRRLCTRVLELRQGRLVEGTPAAPAALPRTSSPPASGPPVLSVRGLSKSFRVRRGLRARPVTAVVDVSFDIAAGEVLALVGESGCGKSTTARMIARLTPPSGGEIRLRGRDALAEPAAAFRAGVQMVFQDPFSSLNPLHTVGYHLARPLLRHRRCQPGPALEAAVAALLESVGLTPEHARRLPHQLSGGQRQRVAIARALAPEPAVLVADEPTSMLDLAVRAEVLELLQRLGRRHGLATLHITHDLGVARAVADRVAVMYGGAIVEVAATETLFCRPAHPYTKLLLQQQEGPS